MIGQTIAAVYLLDNAGLHDIDEALGTGADLPAGSLGHVQNAYVVSAATQWPASLKETASQLTRQLGQLRSALVAGDVNGAMAPAHDAHELGHTLSHMAYDWLGTQAGVTMPSMTGMLEDVAAVAQ